MQKSAISARRLPVQDYFPAESDKELPPEGGWIQVIMPPFTMQYVHYLGVYFAVPVEEGEINSGDVLGKKPAFVKILTETGEVRLYPSEYNRFSNPYKWLAESGKTETGEDLFKINWLAPRNEDFDTNLLHYIMSRGINKAEAYKILLGEITSQNVCFLTVVREIQEYFAGVGVPNLNARSVILRHLDKKPATKEEVEKAERETAEYAKVAAEKEKEQRRQMREQKKRQKAFDKGWSALFSR